ncbi:MAG: hypothetical protein WDW36_007438 [Sanguina aurantia]
MCHHKHRVIAGSIHHILSARVGHAVKQAPVPFLVQNAAPEPSPEVPTEVDATDGPAPAPEKASFADTQQRQQLWNSVSRCLLKLGSRGAAESHIRSLANLLAAHPLVKVQLNGDPAGINDLARTLAEGSGARVLEVQGGIILLARGDLSREEVLKESSLSLRKIHGYHMKRKSDGEAAAAAAAEALQQQQGKGRGKPVQSSIRPPPSAPPGPHHGLQQHRQQLQRIQVGTQIGFQTGGRLWGKGRERKGEQ